MDVEENVREYIDKTVHMSLATARDNKPWVCEVHFAYDDDLNLYYRSLTTRRHSQEIAANPRVAGNVVAQHELGVPGIGVYFEGAAKLLEAGEEQQRAFEVIAKRLQAEGGILEEAQNPQGHQFYKITVENYYIFGPFNGQPSQKYKLEWNGGKK